MCVNDSIDWNYDPKLLVQHYSGLTEWTTDPLLYIIPHMNDKLI